MADVLFINWPLCLMIAREARDKATKIMSDDPDAAPTEALVAIVMSALATEAFINELAGWTKMITADIEIGESAPYDLLHDVANTLAEVETDKGSTALKYQITAKVLSGSTFPQGEKKFQDFRNLMKLRDLIVHLKPGDKLDPQGNVMPRSDLIKNFQQASLTRTRGQLSSQDIPGMSWILEIQTARMASWAYEAAAGIICALVQMLPGEGPGTAGINRFKRAAQSACSTSS